MIYKFYVFFNFIQNDIIKSIFDLAWNIADKLFQKICMHHIQLQKSKKWAFIFFDNRLK